MDNLNHKLKFLPLRYLLIFIIISELLIWLGPINYEINNPNILLLYLVIVNLALFLGYKRGVKKFRPSIYKVSNTNIKFLIILGLFLNIVQLKLMWTSHGHSVSLSSFLLALMNPGEAYLSEDVKGLEGVLIWAILSPIRWASLPIGIFAWKKLSKIYKSLIILTSLIVIISWLGIGTRKGLLDLILIVFFLLLASNQEWIIDNKKFKKFKIIALSFIGIFILYFLFSNLSRYGFSQFSDLAYKDNYDYKPFYIERLSPIILSAWGEITNYLCQGYYALSFGLDLGIRPIEPLSMSWFSIFLANKMGFDPTPNIYMTALERFGIDSLVNWHTIYLWLANEFTFIGVPFIIYIIGYWFAITWCDSISGKNPFAFPIVSLFIIMVFYFFANNQVFSGSYIIFVGCFIFYLYTRKYGNSRGKI